MELFAPVLVLFLTAIAAPWLARAAGRFCGWLLATVPAVAAVWITTVSPGFGDGFATGPVLFPVVGDAIVFQLSAPGLLLAMLVLGIGVLVCIFGGAYFAGDGSGRARFFGLLFFFMGAMLGLALSENLILLFVFWELTSIASYLLIGFKHGQADARRAALDALLITGAGGVALLAGFVLIGEIGGSYSLSELAAQRDVLLAHAAYPAVFWLVFAGAATKSAQFPLHFWLSGAMTAPAPVSAYLHSATMVKAGVFLLMLLQPLLGGTALWREVLLVAGAVTMTWAALFAVVQRDLKKLLALTTVSALGTLVMLLGVGNSLAFKAAVVFLLVHALYKGALFMVAGTVEKATGVRDVSQLNGLLRHLPLLGFAAVAAAFSMSGIPPFVGFIAKELIYEVKVEAGIWGYFLLACGFVTNVANVVVALKVGVAPFLLGKPWTAPVKAGVRNAGFWIGPLLLASGSLLLGVFPNATAGALVGAVVSYLSAEEVEVTLKLWHGLNLVLLLSVATVVSGVAVFLLRGWLWKLGSRLAKRERLNTQFQFRELLAWFLEAISRLTAWVQSGVLSRYLSVAVLVTVGLMAVTWQRSGHTLTLPNTGPLRFEVVILAVLVIASAIGAAVARQRMSAVLLMGCAGFGISGIYAHYGAPDLAITQILVETLAIVLFAVALDRLPPIRFRERRVRILRDAVLATAAGTGFTLLTLKALAVQLDAPVAEEIAKLSVPEAFGRNVVNVILVDFRALDTLGEIVVLLVAALGVAAMLQQGDPGRKVEARLRQGGGSSVLKASATFVVPAVLVFAIYNLLRGHNEPGGGFIGGLMAAMAALLAFLAGLKPEMRVFGLGGRALLAVGLIAALASGLPGLVHGGAFMDAWWGPEFALPFVGKVKLGTVLVFDIGVFLLVAGMAIELCRSVMGGVVALAPGENSGKKPEGAA